MPPIIYEEVSDFLKVTGPIRDTITCSSFVILYWSFLLENYKFLSVYFESYELVLFRLVFRNVASSSMYSGIEIFRIKAVSLVNTPNALISISTT